MEIVVACLFIFAGLLFAAEIISTAIKTSANQLSHRLERIGTMILRLDNMMFRKLDDLVVNISGEDYVDDDEPDEEESK